MKEKDAISESLRAYVAKYPSQTKAAGSLKGVSVGTVSNILNGRYENISDEMFRNVASQVGGVSATGWQIVETGAYQEITAVLSDAQRWRNVAWVTGEAGCGKSTIAALLSGSRTGYTGSVALGGVPVEQLQRAQRLRALTLVPHNATIFKGTVEANLRMAKPDATEAELWAALEQVNLADFCRSQDGLQTALHEGGSNLSGGQRQRLAMARALLHDTPIYLFDEATSNVDGESENDIMAAIRSLAGRKTVILISHRLANVVDSDCIYVLDKGRIAERGTHAELLKKQGTYSRLYTAQKQLETLETEDA